MNSICSRPATLCTWPTVDWNLHQKNLNRKNPGKRFMVPVLVCCAASGGISTSSVNTLCPQTGQTRWRKIVSAVSRQVRPTSIRLKSHLAHRISPLPVFYDAPNVLVRHPIHLGQLIKREASGVELPNVQRVLRRQNCSSWNRPRFERRLCWRPLFVNHACRFCQRHCQHQRLMLAQVISSFRLKGPAGSPSGNLTV